ncbi:MAG TPA: hypothetical protein VF158_14640 [Longimicrobiales bacterium]
MKSSIADLATAVGITALAALGGAGAVYSGIDDAPGGVLLGFLLIVGSLVLGLRAARRRS